MLGPIKRLVFGVVAARELQAERGLARPVHLGGSRPLVTTWAVRGPMRTELVDDHDQRLAAMAKTGRVRRTGLRVGHDVAHETHHLGWRGHQRGV
jgi:hypothetical protein